MPITAFFSAQTAQKLGHLGGAFRVGLFPSSSLAIILSYGGRHFHQGEFTPISTALSNSKSSRQTVSQSIQLFLHNALRRQRHRQTDDALISTKNMRLERCRLTINTTATRTWTVVHFIRGNLILSSGKRSLYFWQNDRFHQLGPACSKKLHYGIISRIFHIEKTYRCVGLHWLSPLARGGATILKVGGTVGYFSDSCASC